MEAQYICTFEYIQIGYIYIYIYISLFIIYMFACVGHCTYYLTWVILLNHKTQVQLCPPFYSQEN